MLRKVKINVKKIQGNVETSQQQGSCIASKLKRHIHSALAG